jgi:hypothetical protein
MKVGDMVVRSYIWHAIVPGIIVGEDTVDVGIDGDAGGDFVYQQTNFYIAWADNTTSNELHEELEYFEVVINESR